MTRRSVGLGLLGAMAATSARASEAPLSDAAIRAVLKDWVEVRRQAAGVVVGVIAPGRRSVLAHGVMAAGGQRPVDGDTIFGLASLTKTFTGLLLAEAVRRGEVGYDDPVARYLPAGVVLPERNGRRITLIDLATHTSGLPHELPDPTAAAAASRAAQDPLAPLYDHLKTVTLEADIGSRWGYSNLGYALLGEALSRRTGLRYESLVRRRITDPLGMADTGVTLTSAQMSRRASPHLPGLAPAPERDKPWADGAGVLQSSVNDLMRYLGAYLGPAKTPLAQAMADATTPRRPAPFVSAEQALGWLVYPQPQPFVFFGGAVPGFCSGMAFDRTAGTGVVVLSNTGELVDNLTRHILRPSLALPPAPAAVFRSDTPLAPFVGDYRLTASLGARLPKDMVFAVRQEGDGLILQIPGAPKAPLTREAEARFVIRGFGFTIEFLPGGHARVSVGPDTATAERVSP